MRAMQVIKAAQGIIDAYEEGGVVSAAWDALEQLARGDIAGGIGLTDAGYRRQTIRSEFMAIIADRDKRIADLERQNARLLHDLSDAVHQVVATDGRCQELEAAYQEAGEHLHTADSLSLCRANLAAAQAEVERLRKALMLATQEVER
jgi:hypothetical protein